MTGLEILKGVAVGALVEGAKTVLDAFMRTNPKPVQAHTAQRAPQPQVTGM